MDPSVWAIVATVPSSEAAHDCTFVRCCNLGNSPINQLRSGCHRLDIGQSPLLGRPGVGLEVEQTQGGLGGWGVSISGTGHSAVGTLGLVMGKLLLGKEEGTRDIRFQLPVIPSALRLKVSNSNRLI